MPSLERVTEIEVMFDLQNWLLRNGVIDVMDSKGIYDFRRIKFDDYIHKVELLLQEKDPYMLSILQERIAKFKDYEKYRK